VIIQTVGMTGQILYIIVWSDSGIDRVKSEAVDVYSCRISKTLIVYSSPTSPG
jgi:hypothetical protein